MATIPRIVITPGEPAGIGPDITVQIAQQAWAAELIFVGDPTLLLQRAQHLDLPLSLKLFSANDMAEAHQPGTLKYIPVILNTSCEIGKLNIKNSTYVIECIHLAARFCLQSPEKAALVTGPVHKGIINDAGIPFSGHTELLATICNVSHSVMFFVADQFRVALATTHIPLAQVSKSINAHHLMNTLRIINKELKTKFKIPQPKIVVCGLNPHAGEAGHLGREEIEIIEPALKQLREEKIDVIGPLPADTVFTQKRIQSTDAFLSMYHDQALPIVKYISFGHAVNVTLGIPIVRTSVDHGTALDVAGTLKADASSLAAAIKLAIELV